MSRCKIGDIAMFIHSDVGNEGRIGQVKDHVPDWAADHFDSMGIAGPYWVVEGRFRAYLYPGRILIQDCQAVCVPDCWLRPLNGETEDQDVRETAEA